MADNTLPKVAETALPVAAMENVTHLRVVSTDNSEKLPKNNFTIAGTKVTVAVDGLSGTVDGAFGDVLTAIAEKADTTQVEALDAEKVSNTGNETIAGVKTFSSSPEVPTPTTDMQASTKKYGDDILAAYGVDVNNVCGAVNHYKRVLADAGGVLDRSWLLKVYEEYIKQRPETVRLYIPELGVKERVSGLNKYGSKVYDMSTVQADASQATEGTQPFMTINAAPNSRKGIRFVQGQTQTGLLDFTDVAFAAGDSWTLTLRIKPNNKEIRIDIGAAARIFLQSTGVNISNGVTGYPVSCSSVAAIGKTSTIEFAYSNGTGAIKIDGIPQVTTAASHAITFDYIKPNGIYFADVSIYAFHLTNTRKSAYQSQLDHAFLSTLFPDMESVAIGNQVWATDNFCGTVAGDGTVIPEVQSAVTAADATNIYNSVYAATSGSAAVKDLAATKAAAMWCHYDNSAANGAIYGKLYNWYAVHLFDLLPPVKGWRIPSKADFDQLVAYLGTNTVAGGKLKAKFGAFNNGFSSNESGFSKIAAGYRGASGVYGGVEASARLWLSDKYRIIFESGNTETASANFVGQEDTFYSLRLLRNEPAGNNELSYTSGLFTTDITSAAKQIPISFGRMVDAIRIKSENALTAIEAKLHNAAGTAVATLITGKTMNAGETKMFTVSADWVSLLQDGTVRVTAAGNSGAAVGMEIEVLTHKGVLS